MFPSFCNLLGILLPVLSGGELVFLPKALVEMGGIGTVDFGCNLGDGEVALPQELCGLLHAELSQKAGEGTTVGVLQDPVHLPGAVAEFLGNGGQCDFPSGSWRLLQMASRIGPASAEWYS